VEKVLHKKVLKIIELKNDGVFHAILLLFFCSPKRKVTKEKGATKAN
jgi:hypothetical protein